MLQTLSPINNLNHYRNKLADLCDLCVCVRPEAIMPESIEQHKHQGKALNVKVHLEHSTIEHVE